MRGGVIGPLLLATLLAGCATTPGDRAQTPAPPDRPGAETMTAAGESLLMQGRAQRAAGDLAQASMTLERALRIEPHEPSLWLELARVRLDENDYGQAEQLARRAGSLAEPGSPLMDSIEALIAVARRRQGGL